MWSVFEIVIEIVANLTAPFMFKGRPLAVCKGFTTSVIPKNRLSFGEINKYKMKLVP